MLQPSVKLSRVTVLFNPAVLSVPGVSPVSLWCDDFVVDENIDGHGLSVPQGITMIAFDLFTLPGGTSEAVLGLTNNPNDNSAGAIQWQIPNSENWTSTPPTAFLVQTFYPNHCTIIDFNTDKNQNFHPFMVNVFYNGTVYPQDPTIINQPPMPVDGGGPSGG